jgi:hypothetical protein
MGEVALTTTAGIPRSWRRHLTNYPAHAEEFIARVYFLRTYVKCQHPYHGWLPVRAGAR